MAGQKLCILLLFAGLACTSAVKMPTMYHVRGFLSLPYAQIHEPFEVWYNEKAGMSRIDFYGDMMSTIQKSDPKTGGAMYKMAYMTTEKVTNQKSCFQINGDKENPVMPQSIFPDTTKFKSIGTFPYKGLDCTAYMLNTVEGGGNKNNTYILYMSKGKTEVPVAYYMKGYDSLLGSHYDEYLLDYTMFSSEVSDGDFEIPKGMKCGDFPGPGVEHHMTFNPMKDFVEHHQGNDRTHQLFREYRQKHGRTYEDGSREHAQRHSVFTTNSRLIHSKNRANLGYTLAINHLADRTDDELKMMRGRTYSPEPNNGLPFDEEELIVTDIPDNINWAIRGAVTPVKDQAVCGSCWSFGAAEAIEGAWFKKTGLLVPLSQQNLMDCSWGYGNNACDGGEEWRAYEWVMKHGGIATAAHYGPYTGADGKCHFDPKHVGAVVTGYVNVTSENGTALKMALANFGPVAVGIDAAVKTFSFYANGVYYDKDCGNKPEDLDHAVLAVGYGSMPDSKGNMQDYWLIKNSWSTHWGDNGYVLISQKDNNCGVATDATYVKV
ncbi:digestive cysteine proteinase 1-like [Branchiostoma floridae]|uniref:Digestive cysteine proteinase 1-like n=1 Tax=Branchiostoma floridae TaxID=7739 RepID=A0A9J7HUD1_BRAFL|nr:digestive cysteine proteinase 1-like [Branchiostoma floridae]